MVCAFAACGTRKVRITGGEPTLRKDFTNIIHTLASTCGVEKVAVTTNGYRMAEHVSTWRSAGLTDINVSVDSLDPRMFQQITGQNRFSDVMMGIERALEAGFRQIKVNVVLMKDINSRELPVFLNWVKQRPIQLRFIELMQTGEMDTLFQRHHLPGTAIRTQLLQDGWLPEVRGLTDGPAQVFVHPDYCGSVGLIMPYERDFCRGCNRLRVSALGKLHLCLFGEKGIELRELLQQDEQQTLLIERIRNGLTEKAEAHSLHEGNTGMTPHLASIGG